MKNRIIALLTVLLLVVSLSVSVFAAVPDLTATGSIRLTLRYGSAKVSGGTVTCIRVGDVGSSGGDYFFTRVLDGELLTDIQNPELAMELKIFAEENNLPQWTKTVEANGEVVFDNLQVGLYLILQREPAEGYYSIQPFLVSVPHMENGEYIYDVDATVKTELEKEPTPITPPNPPTPPDNNVPQTGQLNWPVPVLTIIGLLLFAIGCILTDSRRKGRNEA